MRHILLNNHSLPTYALDINQRAALVIDKLCGKLSTLVRVRPHDMLQEDNIVRAISNLLGVQNNLVCLTCLSKAGDDLVGDICSEVHAQSQGYIMQPDDIPKLFTTGELTP